jgi:hypothetical protein
MVRHIICAVAVLTSGSAAAQEHDHSKMIMTPAQGRQFMQDGVIRFEYNDQGSQRLLAARGSPAGICRDHQPAHRVYGRRHA